MHCLSPRPYPLSPFDIALCNFCTWKNRAASKRYRTVGGCTMACLSNAYFSPPENTVWWGDRPLDWVKSETCIIFSPRREGDCLSFTGKLMAYPLRDVGINCNTRDRVRDGGIGQQSPATLWEPMAAWPTCKNSPEFSTRLCTGKRDAPPSQEKSDSLGHLQAELLPNEDVCRGDWGPELENPSVFWGLQVS